MSEGKLWLFWDDSQGRGTEWGGLDEFGMDYVTSGFGITPEEAWENALSEKQSRERLEGYFGMIERTAGVLPTLIAYPKDAEVEVDVKAPEGWNI